MSIEIPYSRKLAISFLLRLVLIISIVAVAAYYCLIWGVGGILARIHDPQFILIGFVFTLGFILSAIELFILRKFGDYVDSLVFSFRNAFKGDRGERKTKERLKQILDGRYQVKMNLKIPNRKFDIDVIIVGPKGIITLEIKNLSGEYQFEGNNTFKITHRYQNGTVCYCQEGDLANPLKETVRHNLALEDWLREKGISDVKIRGALLMVGDTIISKLIDPAVYVITGIDGLVKYIDGLPENPLFTPEYIQRIQQVLNLK